MFLDLVTKDACWDPFINGFMNETEKFVILVCMEFVMQGSFYEVPSCFAKFTLRCIRQIKTQKINVSFIVFVYFGDISL